MSDAPRVDFAHLALLAGECGLEVRGGFHPMESDGVPCLPDGRPIATVVLLGNVGGSLWPAFSASPELADGRPDPLDRWSRRVIDALAVAVHAMPLFPFDGPPWLPFQRWAMRAEPVFASPIGPLIHPRHGLWHAWRGALGFAFRLDIPPAEGGISPCLSCTDQPCLSTCPVDAFVTGRYQVDTCVDHVVSPAGGDCREAGCRARRACPVGAALHYPAAQLLAFHMGAFLRARLAARNV